MTLSTEQFLIDTLYHHYLKDSAELAKRSRPLEKLFELHKAFITEQIGSPCEMDIACVIYDYIDQFQCISQLQVPQPQPPDSKGKESTLECVKRFAAQVDQSYFGTFIALAGGWNRALELRNDYKATYMPEQPKEKSLLSDRAILNHLHDGSVVIRPFDARNLNTASYDVTLGRYYYRENKSATTVYNIYSENDTARVWDSGKKALEAEKAPAGLDNVRAGKDEIIWIEPGETILAHTNEFIGGRGAVTSIMKARSSIGRSMLCTNKAAGCGDVGYISRWTMEITNFSRFHRIPLVVGRRIAQIMFFETEGTIGGRSYRGKYQDAEWRPELMLPQLYRDRF